MKCLKMRKKALKRRLLNCVRRLKANEKAQIEDKAGGLNHGFCLKCLSVVYAKKAAEGQASRRCNLNKNLQRNLPMNGVVDAEFEEVHEDDKK
jgi:hypothetical protein